MATTDGQDYTFAKAGGVLSKTGSCTSPIPGGVYKGQDDLAKFIGVHAKGTWKLSFEDLLADDGGFFENVILRLWGPMASDLLGPVSEYAYALPFYSIVRNDPQRGGELFEARPSGGAALAQVRLVKGGASSTLA